MAVPAFSDFFRPFLEVLAERGRVSFSEMKELLAQRMALSDEDRAELLPSGKQTKLDNRVGWVRTYLNKSGLIKTVQRGVYELAPEGLALVRSGSPVDVSTLRNYESFRAWVDAPTRSQGGKVGPTPVSESTPLEQMSENAALLRQQLVDEIAEALQEVTWQRFETIVVDVLLALGYGAGRVGAGVAFARSGDGGVDGVINEDKLGLSKIYVQAKRYAPERKISRPDVQAFVGSLLGRRARQGVFITTSGFTKEAQDYAYGLNDQKVVLVDGATLSEYMIDFGVGVTDQESFVVKRLDRDYFEE